MTHLVDIRARLEAYFGGGESRQLVAEWDFESHAPEDMRLLLDAWDFVLDGKPIGYVAAQLDEIVEELETAGDHAMAQTLARLAVMLERLGE